MEQDPGKGGTEADGTRSVKYCSYCYLDGHFVDSFTRYSEMVTLVKNKLKEMGIGPLRRWFYTSHIAHLERWK
jgi:hypothetical protein